MPPQLNTLDIFFTRSKGWLGGAIRKMTCSKGESVTIASHVGMIGCPGAGMMAWGAESVSNGFKFHRLQDHYSPTDEICFFRPLNLTEDERVLIFAEMSNFINRPYGYGKLILHMLDWCIGGKYFFRRIGRFKQAPICSLAVAAIFKAGGKDFGVSTYAASPDDIWDFVLKNPDKYQFVWQQGTMYQG